MPCMGPNRDYAYELGEKAYEEIIKILEEKYGVETSKSKTMSVFTEKAIEHRKRLEEIIKELIWTQHCMDF